MKSLYLAWQAPTFTGPRSENSRAWFPIGRLDADLENSEYHFRYTQGAREAASAVGFRPLVSFPKFDGVYESKQLFSLFQNRVMSPNRKDFDDYIKWLDLDRGQADPIGMLSVSGGERMTDNLEVFPKVTADAAGNFHVRFFLHGLRHVGEKAIEAVSTLQVGEDLGIFVEVNNPATRTAVALLTKSYQMIGWTPRYLVDDIIQSVVKAPLLTAKVARINPDAAPNQRVLIDYYGRAPEGMQPMSTPNFQPLVE